MGKVNDADLVNHLKDLYKVKSEFTYAMKSYCLEYYFATVDNGKIPDWDHTMHDLQLSFGVKEFAVIALQSASGVVMHQNRANFLWPAFAPVHDPSLKSYIGIQNMGTVFTRRFEADHIGS